MFATVIGDRIVDIVPPAIDIGERIEPTALATAKFASETIVPTVPRTAMFAIASGERMVLIVPPAIAMGDSMEPMAEATAIFD